MFLDIFVARNSYPELLLPQQHFSHESTRLKKKVPSTHYTPIEEASRQSFLTAGCPSGVWCGAEKHGGVIREMDVSLGDNPVFLRAGSLGLPALRPCRLPLPTGWQSGLSIVQLSSLCTYLAFHWFAISWSQQTFQSLCYAVVMLNVLGKFCGFYFFLTTPNLFSIFICAWNSPLFLCICEHFLASLFQKTRRNMYARQKVITCQTVGPKIVF